MYEDDVPISGEFYQKENTQYKTKTNQKKGEIMETNNQSKNKTNNKTNNQSDNPLQQIAKNPDAIQINEKMDKMIKENKNKPFVRFTLASIKLNSILQTDAKTKSNKGFDYEYCTLYNLLKKVHFVFGAHGLAVYQYIELTDNKENAITTEVKDMFYEQKNIDPRKNLSYNLVKSSIILPKNLDNKNPNQALGISMTYARRYSLYTTLNIFPFKREDTDGMNY